MSSFEALLGISKDSALNETGNPKKEEEVPTVQELYQVCRSLLAMKPPLVFPYSWGKR